MRRRMPLHRTLSLMLVTGLALTASTSAFATVAPMTDEERMAAADVVVDVEALTAECGGPPSESSSVILQEYITTVTVKAILKGSPAEQIQVRGYGVTWLDEEVSCFWAEEAVQPGFLGRLYLKSGGGGVYSTFDQAGGGVVPGEGGELLPYPDCGPPPNPSGGAGGEGGSGAGGSNSGGEGGGDSGGGGAGAGDSNGNDDTSASSGCSVAGSPSSSGSAFGWLALAALLPLGLRGRRPGRRPHR